MINITKKIKIYFLLVSVLCNIVIFFPLKTQSADTVDRIVAFVDDDVITLYDLNQEIKQYEDKIKSLGYTYEQETKTLNKVREDALNQLIDQKLRDKEIKSLNITINDKEIDSAIERLKQTNSFTEEALKEALAREGFTMESYRSRVKDQLLRAKLVNIKIKSKIVILKDELKAYYDKHKEQYSGAKKYHIRNIVIKANPDSNMEKKIALRKFEEILKSLKNGESFENLAKTYSESSLAQEGGDLGLFRLDELSSNLQEKIKVLKAGETTDIVYTEQGLQIFYLQEIVDTTGKTFEDVLPEIEQKLYEEAVDKKFQSWIEDLRKNTYIKIIR